MTAPQAIAAVSLATGTPEEVILGPLRTREASECRFMVMRLLKNARPRMSAIELARAVNRMDHATGIHGLRRADLLVMIEPTFAAALERAGENLTAKLTA